MSLHRQLALDFKVAIKHLNETLSHFDSASRLLEIAERRRSERSEKNPVEVLEYHAIDDEHGRGVSGRVQGVGGVYDVKICTWVPIRGDQRTYRCSCPDSRRRGREVGPCKHTLALARSWHSDLQDDLLEMAEAFGSAMPSTWRQHIVVEPQTDQTVFAFGVPS